MFFYSGHAVAHETTFLTYAAVQVYAAAHTHALDTTYRPSVHSFIYLFVLPLGSRVQLSSLLSVQLNICRVSRPIGQSSACAQLGG